MIQELIGRIPRGFTLLCASLAFLIPYGLYRMNLWFKQASDPPWRKQEGTD